MAVGYIFGCLTSIILWGFDREKIFYKFNEFVYKKVKSRFFIQVLYVIFIGILAYIFYLMKYREFYNALTAFIVIEISNTEKKALIPENPDKRYFYDSMSIISSSLVYGFIGPLFYISAFNNGIAIAFTLIHYISYSSDLKAFSIAERYLTIIPAVIVCIILYIIYIPRNKTMKIDFKGDFLNNMIKRPMLNVYILAAYIEGVNFYYHVNENNVHYLKSYGIYSKKIDDNSVKDYLSITYSICIVTFVIFWIYQSQIFLRLSA
ncbi:MAG: hypothetical protein KID00_10685 [Clostridium argentinense]|uniref:Uncharacterized protein n=1 Tax=Clostridium faecium TaxID=2762223 RepID=A0ABR8YQD3_9CLOT|nr:hypothetical protein [Clostridium faecium]MBD8046455.1 hypothetical protein [Clostridium faecium]MBS5824304.1 hypothetical protein [Clostridium argentinense]